MNAERWALLQVSAAGLFLRLGCGKTILLLRIPRPFPWPAYTGQPRCTGTATLPSPRSRISQPKSLLIAEFCSECCWVFFFPNGIKITKIKTLIAIMPVGRRGRALVIRWPSCPELTVLQTGSWILGSDSPPAPPSSLSEALGVRGFSAGAAGRALPGGAAGHRGAPGPSFSRHSH